MEQELIEKLGKHTTGKGKNGKTNVLASPIILKDSIINGYYTYRSKLYLLDNKGMDNAFSDYSDKDQMNIYNNLLRI